MKNQPDDASHGCVSDSLRAQAAHCHRLAYAVSDQRTKEVLLKLGNEYEAQADALDGPESRPPV